ncbi:predicted protein [Naegleria gruberi]|uniref:Predicted protein n=1 Tax=Naegleria gruberi TaxID=5762 RepID=D2VUL3_NAEGR|nr:uncharacterized protein NAEGRDRAFT_52381 [Naegleria gruberi]EFC39472.1 predicted protein [Naegleria gruberi]|eukprot:XP_002672216.1 predicted protein [Naegleria gruberi strain NEG-M]
MAIERLILDETQPQQQDHILKVCYPSDSQPTIENLVNLDTQIEKSFQDFSAAERDYLQCIYKSGLQRLIPFQKHKKTTLDIVVVLCAEQVYSKDDESRTKFKWISDRFKLDTLNRTQDEIRKIMSLKEQTIYKTVKGLADFKKGMEDYYSILDCNEEDRISVNYYLCLQKYHGLDENYFPKIEEDMSEIQKKRIQSEIDFTNEINELCMEFPFIRRIYEKQISDQFIKIEHLDSYFNNCQILDSVKLQRKINCKFYGEGKSMNQLNSAMFLKGKYMLSLDSNMDAYYFEGIKFPCLMQEVMNSKSHIFGMRTHTYTAFTSQVGKNMACAEHVFVATCYKAMCLLGSRLHYGNADILDREFFIEKGLFADADRYLNLSEDVFLGKRCLKFGGIIRYSEGVTFGKGRETNLKESAGFYTKIAGGAAMQSSSSIEYELNSSLPLCMLMPL